MGLEVGLFLCLSLWLEELLSSPLISSPSPSLSLSKKGGGTGGKGGQGDLTGGKKNPKRQAKRKEEEGGLGMPFFQTNLNKNFFLFFAELAFVPLRSLLYNNFCLILFLGIFIFRKEEDIFLFIYSNLVVCYCLDRTWTDMSQTDVSNSLRQTGGTLLMLRSLYIYISPRQGLNLSLSSGRMSPASLSIGIKITLTLPFPFPPTLFPSPVYVCGGQDGDTGKEALPVPGSHAMPALGQKTGRTNNALYVYVYVSHS